jgi:hypothetical protein
MYRNRQIDGEMTMKCSVAAIGKYEMMIVARK